MSNGRVHIVKVYSREHLERTGSPSSDVGKVLSQPIPVVGNSVKIDLTVVNSLGLGPNDKLKLLLEGSYDGKVWQVDGLNAASEQVQVGSANPLNRRSFDTVRINYAFLRLKANLIGSGNTQAIFNASLIFTSQ